MASPGRGNAIQKAQAGRPLMEREGGKRRMATTVLGSTAALAVLVLVALVASADVGGGPSELLLQAQAPLIADVDAAKFGAGDNGANWDQGWLNKFVADDERADRGRIEHRAVSSSSSNKASEEEQIHLLLAKAVDMMGDLEHKKRASTLKGFMSAAETEPVEAPSVAVEAAAAVQAAAAAEAASKAATAAAGAAQAVAAAAAAAPAAAADAAASAPGAAAAAAAPADAATSAAIAAMNTASQARFAKYDAFARKVELPACFKLNKFTDAEKVRALQRMSTAADNLKLTYPGWAKGVTIPGKGQDGEWRHDRGPPYVKRITMFAGPGVDTKGNGNLVRRVLGLTTAFQKVCDLRSCDHAMTGNAYIRDFDGSQFRFLYRNACSTIVIPPLTRGAGPVLSDNGLYRLHHYLKDGFNTVIVCGSTASVLFLNQNIATLDGGFQLEPSWVEGPYEAQAAQMANTPFAALAATLPGPGTGVTGVHVSSLPANAISYYEAEDVSVVFEIPMGQGRLIYLGYDYAEPVTPWVHALVAATMFNDYDFKGKPLVTTSSSVNRLKKNP